MVLHYLRRRLCCQAHNQISCFTVSLCLVTPTDPHPLLCCNKHSDCAYLQFESLFEQGGYEQESGEVKLENLKVWFSNSKSAASAETQAPQFGCAALMWTAEQPRWIPGPGVACQF